MALLPVFFPRLTAQKSPRSEDGSKHYRCQSGRALTHADTAFELARHAPVERAADIQPPGEGLVVACLTGNAGVVSGDLGGSHAVPGKMSECRIQRFQRVFRELESGGNWVQAALACGYYDQAHLVRDMRQFAGETPSALLKGDELARHFLSHFSKTAGRPLP